ncbi:MAG: hypothetical protein ACREOH_10555 [Candidatus Entotheonellia bacterium]
MYLVTVNDCPEAVLFKQAGIRFAHAFLAMQQDTTAKLASLLRR